MGKTALLLACEQDAAADFLVVRTRGVHEEAGLAFVGLHRLLLPLAPRFRGLPRQTPPSPLLTNLPTPSTESPATIKTETHFWGRKRALEAGIIEHGPGVIDSMARGHANGSCANRVDRAGRSTVIALATPADNSLQCAHAPDYFRDSARPLPRGPHGSPPAAGHSGQMTPGSRPITVGDAPIAPACTTDDSRMPP